MFFAALAHYYSFSHKPYIDPMAEQTDCCQSFIHMWDISDIRQDVREHVTHIGKVSTVASLAAEVHRILVVHQLQISAQYS